jgi:O-antigen/teichoic acid export membrane protein
MSISKSIFFLKNSIKNNFLKNIIVSISGNSIAQVIPIIFYPVLTKIYLPGEFGLVSSLMTITTFLSVIISLKYESAIFVANSKNEALNVLIFVLLLSGLIISIIYLPLILFSNSIVLKLKYYNLDFGLYFLFIPIIAYSIVIYNSYNEWCIKNGLYKSLVFNKISNSSSIVFFKYLFGVVKYLKNGLIIGELFGRFLPAFFSFCKLIKDEGKNIKILSIPQYKLLAYKFINFPKYSLFDQIINQIIGSFPIIFIGIYFNINEVGFFVMSMNILSVPMSVFGLSISDVFRKILLDSFRYNDDSSKIYLKFLKILFLIGIILFFILYNTIPFIFNLLLGSTWDNSIKYAFILLPSTIIGFISMSLSGVLIATNNNRLSMIWQFIYLTLVLISFFIGFLIFNNIFITITIFSGSRIISYLLYIYFSYNSLKNITFDNK